MSRARMVIVVVWGGREVVQRGLRWSGGGVVVVVVVVGVGITSLKGWYDILYVCVVGDWSMI